MKTSNQIKLDSQLCSRITNYAAFAGAVLASASFVQDAKAAVIFNPNLNLSIPNNIDGVYFDLVTGDSGTSSDIVPGYDINPYNNGSGLTFYGDASPYGILASGTAGTAAIAQHLVGGETIGSGSTFFNQFQTRGTLFQNSGVAYVGVAFLNEATNQTNYGWLEISSTAGTGTDVGFPATITRYAYEDTGAPIAAGAVPEPGTNVMLGFGAMVMGAVGVRRWRSAKPAVV